MVSHKALKARLKLLAAHGVTEYIDGDLRLILGSPDAEEYVVVAPSPEVRAALIAGAQQARDVGGFDPTSPADLVLQTQKIEPDAN